MGKWLAVVFFLSICPDTALAFLPAAAIPAASASGPLAPFVIGGIAAFTFLSTKLWGRSELGQLKVELTKVYNDAAEGLEENLARYLSEPTSLIAQKERLTYFDKIWKELKEQSLKTAQGMISWNERQRNGKYPWEVYFRDPIANDPRLSTSSGGTYQEVPSFPQTPLLQGLPADTIPGPTSAENAPSAIIAISILIALALFWILRQ